ncbi:neural proliferation differentiation and control protein 1-like isoform X2 [Rhinoraja longicauda]
MVSVRGNRFSDMLVPIFFFIFTGLSHSGAASRCPSHLDCALLRRNPCIAGSEDCGPCLPGYREDGVKKCTLNGHQRQATLLAPGLKLTDSNQAPSISNSSRAPQSMEGPWTTAKTTPGTRPVRGRDESKKLSRLLNDVVSLSLVIICTVTGLFGLAVAALCWYRLQKEVRLAQKMVYEGVQPPWFMDRRVVDELQRHHYHYQHQKKVIQALERKSKMKRGQMSSESEPENENGEYTVYECPGLATTGEMEIHNPLFDTSILKSTSSIEQQ